ncbi:MULTISPECIES: mevalonate kinase [unclassified Methanosarcina]|uniref:mevalonate kinase n=1 Tax=unclassified Methanosarcina TaxID=2644672 RepID=UPI000615B03F|nr:MULTISPECIES: mevalonate kinase [unclassified Methanosarcina]AKB19167.1 Mevalonate kinase [Methanosarcina sp. WWM596]AKB23005.1 Mevalonate kinase [Methanosarcina sp. WH1]
MVSCSAPGKIYLFGEHAVVYGETAIACAVELRTRVRVELNSSIVIQSQLGKTGLDFEKHPYVSAVIEKMKEFVPIKGVFLTVDSDIPVGSGLGSSAAVTIASIGALNEFFVCGLSLEEIAKLGHEIEIEVQGAASPTDTYVSTFGGVVTIPERRKLKTPDCEIVIGDTGVFSSTKELVANVRQLRESYPELIRPLMASIGKISRIGETLVLSGDYASIGRLMNVNQGLLDALGVNILELSCLIYSARAAGAFGAKITGAGGGGCMVALTATEKSAQVAGAIARAGGKVTITKPTEQGLKVD